MDRNSWSIAMSYLDTPRIHFFGQFFGNPSTINNDLSNYALQPPLDLSWNPNGSAFFRFVNCRVSSAVGADGKVVNPAGGDPIVAAVVSTPQAPQTKVAKIVDLDPDQQSITQLFGVVVTVALSGGQASVTGRMAVAELRDLWIQRVAGSPGGDGGASGIWQSVLTDLQWSGLDRSTLLKDLHDASPDRLSIKFNCDTYDDQAQSPTFNQGRLAGTIGPYFAGEPIQVVIGRRLLPAPNSPYWPAPFQVSQGSKRLAIDLGNSIPLQSAGGETSGPSMLNAVILAPQGPITLTTPIDVSRQAYQVNAGVCDVPITPDQANLLDTSPLGLVASGQTTPLLSEASDGRYVNVEPFSLRLNPGDSGTVTLYARQFGKPLAGLQLSVGFDDPGLPGGNTPSGALTFQNQVTTLPSGQASLEISASPPQPLPDRRAFIDSQVYFLGGDWEAWGQISALSGAAISVLVFNNAPPVEHPTWSDVQPILNQYAVLYPAMKQRLDLSDYDAVSSNASEVLDVISLPIEDPAHMPVTRDLSKANRTLIQTWINAGSPR
jgi:hypothetical protein